MHPEWASLALDPPRASAGPRPAAVLKLQAADFRVEECLGFAPDGGSAHVLLQVEKTDANTAWVARRLAQLAGCRSGEVGYAGLKDRRAVTLQWFSVPRRGPVEPWLAVQGEGFRVLEAHPHSRKLRRGALAGNQFRLVLRQLQGDLSGLEAGLDLLRQRGAPNYFGLQRFGRGLANLHQVEAWASGTPLPRDREQRAFVISTARSLIFNAVLASRVRSGSWDRLLQGEVVNLAGSNSVFLAPMVDEELSARCAAFDVHPTGPLSGIGGLSPSAEAAEAECAATANLAALEQRLVEEGIEASRRALRVPVIDLDWTLEGDALELAFTLPRGAFATSLLGELFELTGGEELPAAD
ncbi:MAG: tRNA pseudouridine(13) synthase TruD [Steroidobacteraceae bacterium]